jgi:uncharacterized protein (TIGR04255 family)
MRRRAVEMEVRFWFAYSTRMPTLDPKREIYPNAPLRLVAFELRYPAVPELLDAQPELDQRLRKRLPLLGPPPVSEMHFEVAAGASPRAFGRQGGLRRTDRRRRQAVAITPIAATIETSEYTRFEEFRGFVEEVLGYLAATVELPAVERVGIRYIDEVDPVDFPQPVDWSDYIAPELLRVSEFFGHEPLETNTVAVFAPAPGQQLVLRYGVAQAPVVNPGGPLHITRSPAGPYFLIDIDSGWNAPADDLPEFAVDEVLDLLDRLHAPVRDVFEQMITDKLRDHLRTSRENDQ